MSDSIDILALLNGLLHEGGIDSYLAFFKKRLEIEEEYHSALSKLSQRQIDRYHSESESLGSQPSLSQTATPETVRKAWREITGNVGQEAALRRSWVQRVKLNVLEPLEKFRTSKDRTLSRIREELRSSFTDHKDYSATVHRLKKQYERKCDEVQQFHAMQEAADYREKLFEESAKLQQQSHGTPTPLKLQEEWEHVGTTPSSTSPITLHDKESSTQLAASHLSRKSVETLSTSPNPSSGAHLPPPPPHPMTSKHPIMVSGATSTALKDTATPAGVTPLQARSNDVLQALRSNTNNLISRLNSRKDRPAGQASSPLGPDDGAVKPSAMKGVKLRREAEDADRDYRKAVFHLDTLRLRKEQVIRGARRASEEIVYEMAGETKETFGYYMDETKIAAIQHISICDHAQHLIDKINPEDDALRFADALPADYVEPQVLYENAFIGPCRSLLFGVAITDYVASNPGKGLIPLLVTMCIEEIEKKGLRLEGIYRVSGKMAMMTQLVHEIEKDENRFRFGPEHDPHVVSAILKLYLRQLPVPLFNMSLQDRVTFSKEIEEHEQTKFSVLSKRIRKLHSSHQATLKLLCEHLSRVAAHSDQNKMNLPNLGVVITPAVFGEDTGMQLPMQAWKDSVMEVLILHHESLFEGLPLTDVVPSGRQPRRSFGHSRALSPGRRKSLEADRFDSYSRSVSPSGLGVVGQADTGDRGSDAGTQRSRSGPPLGISPAPSPPLQSTAHTFQSLMIGEATSSPVSTQAPRTPFHDSPSVPTLQTNSTPPLATTNTLPQQQSQTTPGSKTASPKRSFSLRKRSNPNVSESAAFHTLPTSSSQSHRERPDTMLFSGPEYSKLPTSSTSVGTVVPVQPSSQTSLPTTPLNEMIESETTSWTSRTSIDQSESNLNGGVTTLEKRTSFE